jgi:redox-sensitive bicupin YhaK (pirin superfamily)
MSPIVDTSPESPAGAGRRVARVVRGRPASDGAGVRLTRVIGSPELPDHDPFLMLDEFRSDKADDYLAGFPDHPHRGFETVTYMLAGRMRHGDNKGNSGLLLPGGAQWMTAGRGIVHSEMPEQQDGLMWGFQLWVNLPARDKLAAPRYQDIEPAAIPETDLPGGAHARVLAGRLANATGPATAAATEPLYLDITLPEGATAAVPVPPGHAAFAYVYDGAARIGPKDAARRLGRGELAVLSDGAQVEIAADSGGRLILVAGKPLGEPVAKYGPFVMNTYDEIRQAVVDFQAGRF